MHLLLRKYGNLLDVSTDGASPTPQAIVDLLAPALTYTQREHLRGADAYDPLTGKHQRVRLTTRAVWQLSLDGKLTTPFGFLYRVAKVLRDNGCTPHFVDVSPPRKRPNCYDGNWDNVCRFITFRPRQQECVQAVLDNPCGVIKAVTGFGKTELFAALALYYSYAKIDIVVDSIDIARDIQRRMLAYVPGIGFIGDGDDDPQRVTVVSASSLHKVDGEADIVFGEECHQLAAPSVAEPFAYKYRHAKAFGWSATPYGRSDGTEARVEAMFGPMIFEITYQEAEALGLVVPVRVNWLPIEMPENPVAGYKADAAKKRWGIWRNDFRNNAYAEFIHNNYPVEKQILLLVETIEHAVHLRRFLPEFQLVYANMKKSDFAGYVASGLLPADFPEMTPDRRMLMKAAFQGGSLRRVIATDVWSTGVDFKSLEVVGRLDEREGEVVNTQGPGRVSRIYDTADGPKQYGEVIDAIDYWDDNFKRKSRARYKHYDGMGWTQNWPSGRRQIADARGPRA